MDSKNQGNDNQQSASNAPNTNQNNIDPLAGLTNLPALGNLGGIDLNALGIGGGLDPNLMNLGNPVGDIKMPTGDLGALGNTGGVDLSSLGNLFGGQDLNQLLAGMGTNPGAKPGGMPTGNAQLGGANLQGMAQLGNIGMPGLDLNLQNQSNSNGLMGQGGIPQMPNVQGLNNFGTGQGANNFLGNLGGLPANFGAAGLQGLPNMGMNNMNFNANPVPQMGGMPRNNNMGGMQQLVPGSQQHQASFHQKGPDYEIKIFVGGLAFQTLESNLIEYFKQFGVVADAIVMRDRATGRGRGFGFVKMQFENKDKAQENKLKLIGINSDRDSGHYINDKRVDVKSADDFVKPAMGPGSEMGGGFQQNFQPRPNQFNPMGGMPPQQMQQQQRYTPGQPPEGYTKPDSLQQQQPQDPLLHVNKPNPWVIVEEKQDNDGQGGLNAQEAESMDKPKEVVYKYPKSKIFVGGLDFKLTNEDLKQHFQQYGAIESAVILKNINNGQSRGFGFVTFKDEAVAQDLIQNMGTTNIFGRKVDIRSAEPKQQNSSQPAPIIPRGGYQGPPGRGMGGQQGPNGYAMIPKYGDGDSQGSSRGSGRENFDRHAERPQRNFDDRDRRGGHYRGDYRDERDGYRPERRRRGYDEEERGGRDKEYRHGRSRHHYRSDSEGSQESSSSHKHRRHRDKRGPHHGSNHKSTKEAGAAPSNTSKGDEKETKNRSRSRSNK